MNSFDNETSSLATILQPTYDSINSSEKTGSPMVFCIHGNKYGIVKCCDDLDNVSDSSPLMVNKTKRENQGSSHCHPERRHSQDRIDVKARRKLILASVLCVMFMIAEVIGGFIANSLAIATDAAHLLTDFASFMISLFSLWVASLPPTRRMSFGWHRAEVIGATVSVLMIWVVTGILVYMAIQRVIYRNFEIDAVAMLITSGAGVVFNMIMGCTLHQHGHSHNHNADAENRENNNNVNINVKAAYIHVIGDFLQSVGVFVAALTLYFQPTWVLVDPICTFIFSVLVLLTTIKILRNTVHVLMEGKPENVEFTVVEETFLSVDGIKAVHNLRIWGITMDKMALSAHLAIKPGVNPQSILKEASRNIRKKYDFYEMTLQIEDFEENMEDCRQCKNPQS